MQLPVQNQEQSQPSRISTTKWVVLAVVVVLALIGLGFLLRAKIISKNSQGLSGYQAVFLTNGQVYFGKMGRGDSHYVTLTDIFYLQVNQPLQSGTTTPAQQAAAAQTTPQLSLVKLGNELHGPQDLMYISRDQILFYENMEASGKVAQAITVYKASKDGTSSAGSSDSSAGAAVSPNSSSGQLQNPATTGQGASTGAGAPPVTVPVGQ